MCCKFDISAALSENGRLASVNGVLKAFGQIMAADRGEVMCTVTTAKVCVQIEI